ncbi:MAG: PTS sugar transporter subunit IIC [Gemmatimonadales bacterium]|nr:PTS sugar transporter subunit IIC [Gemmatimonadales bacterium]
MTPLLALALWGWCVIVTVDLVSAPQGLLARPVVAASVAGLLAGNLAAGLLVGVALELYALDVLPIGAARYPDYGAAAASAAAAAALVPEAPALALAGLIGLPLAILGGWTLHVHRRRSAESIHRRLERVTAGEARAIWELQRNGLIRDAGRGVVLGAIGLSAIVAAGAFPWSAFPRMELVGAATVAGGLAAALGGALRSGGQGARRRWLAVGMATGLLLVLSR